MRKEKNPYKIFNHYCLRTPLFPINYFNELTNKENISEHELKEVFKNKVFNEALYLASPELHHQALKWCGGGITDDKKRQRIELSILKYITRICTRCTPFGLFASCSTGNFDIETNIKLEEIDLFKRFTRFDMTFLSVLLQELLKNKEIRKNLLFYQNTSLYKIGNQFRYVEYSLKKDQREYSLEGILYSEYLEKVLNESKAGKTIHQLALQLQDDDIVFNEATDFIEELIDKQILVSELEITITGKHYFEQLIHRIQQIPNTEEALNQLLVLKSQIKSLDTNIGNNPNLYQRIIESTKKISKEFDSKYLFQTDCFSTAEENNLDGNIQKQLRKALVLFNKMSLPSANKNIVSFKRSFLKRFEQKEIPLSLVLDTETGIGYGDVKDDDNSLLDDLSLPPTKKRYQHVIWTDVDSVLQKKTIKIIQNKEYTIKLSENDFKEFSANWEDLPDTFSSIIEIFNSENGEKIFINGAGGTSAANLLGRFCYGDKQLLEQVKEMVKIEEEINSDKILAEIVHLPESRTGNILQRPKLRNYEISYLGKSSLQPNYQISIEDILVSIRNDKIILRSKKLDKEILPRLGNAHNYGVDSLPVYHFLCELQAQNKRTSIGFRWNSIFRNQQFLPRVEFENIIFSKARWNIEVESFKKILTKNNIIKKIKTWQKKMQIPQFVQLVEGDNKLLINLKNENSVRMLYSSVRNRKKFVLEEFLFVDNRIVKGKDNDYCNQFVVSFYNDLKAKLIENEE